MPNKKGQGRKAKPTALKLIQGNPGKRPINEEEPKPAIVYKPRAPRGLTKDEQAKWRQMVRRLSAMRVLTEADLDALEIYVRNWCAMHTALADLNVRGKLVQTPSGGVMWNPSWSEYKHALQVCRSLQAEFGLTPSSRTGVKADAGGDGRGQWADY